MSRVFELVIRLRNIVLYRGNVKHHALCHTVSVVAACTGIAMATSRCAGAVPGSACVCQLTRDACLSSRSAS